MADILPGERPWHERGDDNPQWDNHYLSNMLDGYAVRAGIGVVYLSLYGQTTKRRVTTELPIAETERAITLLQNALVITKNALANPPKEMFRCA